MPGRVLSPPEALMTLLGCKTQGLGSLKGLARATQLTQPLSSQRSLLGLEGKEEVLSRCEGQWEQGSWEPWWSWVSAWLHRPPAVWPRSHHFPYKRSFLSCKSGSDSYDHPGLMGPLRFTRSWGTSRGALRSWPSPGPSRTGLSREPCSAKWLGGLAACQPGGRVSWGRV